MAVFALGASLHMIETPREDEYSRNTSGSEMDKIAKAFALTMNAGKWILKTPYALVVIMTGLLFDGIIRMVITLSSQYYRLIQIPEALFGIIGSALAVLGLIIPRLASIMAGAWSPAANLIATAFIAIVGLVGMSMFLSYYGLVFSVILASASYFTGFFISYYLNRITDSSQRATVLSFKGFSFNLAYGLIGILYSILLAWIRYQNVLISPEGVPGGEEDLMFISSFAWFPWTFALLCLMVGMFSLVFSKDKKLLQRG
jgi:hypothetical protein